MESNDRPACSHLFDIVIYRIAFFRALEMSACSVMKLVHESARIARQAVYCTVVLQYGTVGEVDQDIPEQYGLVRYDTHLHSPLFLYRTALNASVNGVLHC